MNSRLSWSDLTKDQSEQLAKEAVEILAPKLQNEILLVPIVTLILRESSSKLLAVHRLF